MQQVWRLWGHVVVAAVVAVPAAVAAARLLARRRTRDGHPLPVRTAAADVAMVAGTVPWIWMILTPGTVSSTVSLIPFRDLSALLHAPAGRTRLAKAARARPGEAGISLREGEESPGLGRGGEVKLVPCRCSGG